MGDRNRDRRRNDSRDRRRDRERDDWRDRDRDRGRRDEWNRDGWSSGGWKDWSDDQSSSKGSKGGKGKGKKDQGPAPFANLEEFRARYPMDDRAWDFLNKAPEEIHNLMFRQFKPKRPDDTEFSAAVTAYVRALRKSMGLPEEEKKPKPEQIPIIKPDEVMPQEVDLTPYQSGNPSCPKCKMTGMLCKICERMLTVKLREDALKAAQNEQKQELDAKEAEQARAAEEEENKAWEEAEQKKKEAREQASQKKAELEAAERKFYAGKQRQPGSRRSRSGKRQRERTRSRSRGSPDLRPIERRPSPVRDPSPGVRRRSPEPIRNAEPSRGTQEWPPREHVRSDGFPSSTEQEWPPREHVRQDSSSSTAPQAWSAAEPDDPGPKSELGTSRGAVQDDDDDDDDEVMDMPMPPRPAEPVAEPPAAPRVRRKRWDDEDESAAAAANTAPRDDARLDIVVKVLSNGCPKCQAKGEICKVCEKLVSEKKELEKNTPKGLSGPDPSMFRRPTRWELPQEGITKDTPFKAIEENLTGPIQFKVLQFDEVQIRSLIGKGGETIRELRSKVGYTDVTVQHKRGDDFGLVRITGDIKRAEALIRETLDKKGCLFNRKSQYVPFNPPALWEAPANPPPSETQWNNGFSI